MPFVNGKFYINPSIGRVLERNRDRAIIANFAQSQPQAESPEQRDSNGHWVTINGRHVFIEDAVTGVETPQATRKTIAATAMKYNRSTAWAFTRKKDNFPANTNKCNKFVYDVTEEAGAPAIVIGSDGRPRPPLAAEWADPKVQIPGWHALGPNEKPEPGDVAAWPHRYSDATGHSGVVVSVGLNGHVTAMAAHYGDVDRDGSFNRSREHPVVTYRRYTGD